MDSFEQIKKNEPKAELIHDCPADAGSPLLQQGRDGHRRVARRLVRALPVRVPKASYMALDLEAENKTKRIKTTAEHPVIPPNRGPVREAFKRLTCR